MLEKERVSRRNQIEETLQIKLDALIEKIKLEPFDYNSQLNEILRAGIQASYQLAVDYVTQKVRKDAFLTSTDLEIIKEQVDSYSVKFQRKVDSILHRNDVLLQKYNYEPRSPLNSNYMASVLAIGIVTTTMAKATLAKIAQLKSSIKSAGILERFFRLQDIFTGKGSGYGVPRDEFEDQVQWNAILDDRTCFPRFTLVKTDRGDKFISEVNIGDWILTRFGYRKCIGKSSKKFKGKINTIRTSKGKLTATFDHPIWVNGYGWKFIEDIMTTDVLQSFNNESIKVFSNVNFILSKPNNIPSKFIKIFCFSNIFSLIFMPILTINFKNNFSIWKDKITRISTNLKFLNKLQPKSFKRFPNFSFNRCFTLKSPITSKRTVGQVSDTVGTYSILNRTVPTSSINWRSSTDFRTINSRSVLSSINKYFTTSLTLNTNSLSKFTPHTTKVIPIDIASENRELFLTYRTNFSNMWFMHRIITFHRAISSVTSNIKTSLIFHFSTFRTRNFLTSFKWRSIIAFPLTQLQLIVYRLINKPLIVYDIEVEDQHEFYANGILVHNCPYCLSLHGSFWYYNDPHKPEPGDDFSVHPNCRCMWDYLPSIVDIPLVVQLAKLTRQTQTVIQDLP